MMAYEPVQISDHIDQGLMKALNQFKDKPLFEALLSSYLKRIQKLEIAIWEVVLIRGISNSEGVNLDHIGVLVGRPRLGLPDIDYRTALRAQIRINRSSGRPNDVIEVARLSLSEGLPFAYDHAYPATIQVDVNGPLQTSAMVLLDNLIRTKSAGVRLLLIYSITANQFTLSQDDNEVIDPLNGFGDDLDLSIGGYLAFISDG